MHKSLYLSLPKRKKSAAQPPLFPAAGNSNNDNNKKPTASALYENFNSLCNSKTIRYGCGPVSDWSPRLTEMPPESIQASERFFVNPGLSSSLIEEARLSTGSPSPQCEGKAVVIRSRDPDADFLRSMLEMVEARHVDPEEPLDWEFMEKLLCCFLQLNDRRVHNHIIRAFTNLAAAGFRRGTLML